MIIHAIKTAVFILTAFNHGIFAKCDTSYKNAKDAKWIIFMDNYCKKTRMYEREGIVIGCGDALGDYIEVDVNGGFTERPIPYLPPGFTLKKEFISIYADDNGSKDTTKTIFCGDIDERIKTKYDSIGNLIISEYEVRKNGERMSSRIEIWKKNKLVRIKYNDIPRSIVQGKTPCNLEVFEPRGKSVILVLDPKNKPDSLIRKYVIDSVGIYDAIKYYWHPHCKEYSEKQKIVEISNVNDSIHLVTENESGNLAKNDIKLLSYTLPYKYCLMIIVAIMVASITIIYKKRKRNKK